MSAIEALERRVWDALVSGDAQADADLLHTDFIGVYPSGFAVKDDHTGQLAQGPVIREYNLSEINERSLGPDHRMICYRATFQRPDATQTECMLVTSIWQRTATAWINIFSQDTPTS